MRVLGLFLSIFIGFTTQAADVCPDETLKNQKWQVQSNIDVEKIADSELEVIYNERGRNVSFNKFRTFSTVAGKWVYVYEYDSKSTPDEEMMGDLLIIKDMKTEEVLEVRVYKFFTRFSFYDSTRTPCATNLIPLAENSLY